MSFIGKLTCKIRGHNYPELRPAGIVPAAALRGEDPEYWHKPPTHQSSRSTGRHEIALTVCTRCEHVGYYVPLEENL